MWDKISDFIIRFRVLLLTLIGFITIFMVYEARKVEMTYDFLKILPTDDEELIYFQKFKETFGEDGNLIAVGLKDKTVFELQKFIEYQKLVKELSTLKGINEVIALPRLKAIVKDTVQSAFHLEPIFKKPINTQAELDSLVAVIGQQKIYEKQLYNPETSALLIAISVTKQTLNSADRQRVSNEIHRICEEFSAKTGIKMHYGGIPYMRAVMSIIVSKELQIFLFLSFVISGIVLFVFFRSWAAVVVPLFLVVVVVIWTFGSLALFDYKISMLTGLIPTLIVITGIPNFIYLINKYHQEFLRHRNKMKAISQIIKSIGVITFMTNLTTAVGFWVLCTNDVSLMKEFGIIAGLNIMVAFVISIVVVPALLVYMPEPSEKQLKHLDSTFLNGILDWTINLVENHRKAVYIGYVIITIVCIIGTYQIKTISYMLDDVPEKLSLKTDLTFFENNFKGIMPLEFEINTHKKSALMKLSNLDKIDEFENFLFSLPEISQPVSVTTFLKGATQAYYNGDSSQYRLPTSSERFFLLKYLKNNQKKGENFMRSFVDTSVKRIRISCKVADIGSIKLDSLMNFKIKPKIAEIFGETNFDVKVTGTTVLFVRGNSMLINGLNSSIVQSVLFNALLMAMLFASFRMIIISLVPNFIPLLITAAIMGFCGIHLKPSTSIIFSIVFGITVDNTIHFLAKYRYEIFHHRMTVRDALISSIRDSGPSMIYTSIVLFFGFIIFVASSFGGTVALGILTSITILTALVTNMTILPCLLMSYDRGRYEQDFTPLFEHYEDFYFEDEDEEINLDLLKIDSKEIVN